MNPARCAEVCSICAGKPSFLAVWTEHSSCPREGENTGWVQKVYTGNFQRILVRKMKILCWVLVQNLCLVEGDQEPKGSTQTSLATLQALVAVPFALISGQQSKKNVLVGVQKEDVVLGRSVLPKQTLSVRMLLCLHPCTVQMYPLCYGPSGQALLLNRFLANPCYSEFHGKIFFGQN